MIEPRRATIPVTIDVPWEIAELLVVHGPAFLQAISAAVRCRETAKADDSQAKLQTAAACDANIRSWRALAQECLAEVRRRSNGPGQKRSLIKQLAAERGVTPQFLTTIIKVHGKKSAEVSDLPAVPILSPDPST